MILSPRKAIRAAYRQGYVDALEVLKANLQAEAEQRLHDRRPYSIDTLAEAVINTANELIRKMKGSPCPPPN